jgi:hypothetical protein
MEYFGVAEIVSVIDIWRSVVNTVMNLRVLYNTRNFFTSVGNSGFSGRTLFPGSRYVVDAIVGSLESKSLLCFLCMTGLV